MMPDATSAESLPTMLLLVVPALSLFVSYLVFALVLRLFGPEQPTPAGAAGPTEPDPSSSDTAGIDDRNSSGSTGGGTVVACPDCGTENERGYRYCRSCVAELPGSNLPITSSSTPLLRGIN